jgi:hypothetical protein
VELGLAYASKWLTSQQEFLVGLHTDRRAAFLGAKLNPMLTAALDRVVSSEEELLSAIGEFGR